MRLRNARQRGLAAVLALGLCHAAAAQVDGGAAVGASPLVSPADAEPAWERALRQNYTITRMEFAQRDSRTGLPKGNFFIYGNLDYLDRPDWLTRLLRWTGLTEPPPPPPRGDPDALAQQFLEREAKALGSATWQLDMNEEARRGRRQLTYHSYVGALRVARAEVNIHVSSQGIISAVTGYIVHLPKNLPGYVLDRQQNRSIPSISEPQAARAAAKDMGIKRGHMALIAAARQVIAERPFVVWRMEVSDRRQDERSFIYVIDDRNGEVLERRSVLRF